MSYFCSLINKNRMLAYFYITRLSNDMKIAVHKNSFSSNFAHILHRSLDHSKKNDVKILSKSRLKFQIVCKSHICAHRLEVTIFYQFEMINILKSFYENRFQILQRKI